MGRSGYGLQGSRYSLRGCTCLEHDSRAPCCDKRSSSVCPDAQPADGRGGCCCGFFPSREPDAKRARSADPRQAFVGSYLASVPEGAPCMFGLEPEAARRRGSVLGRPFFGVYPCSVCSSSLPAHARVCYACRCNDVSACLTEACWECDLRSRRQHGVSLRLLLLGMCRGFARECSLVRRG